MSGWTAALLLLLLSALAYLPTLRLPFIADDFVQIPLALQYAQHGWSVLLTDTNLRTRATYMLLDGWLDQAFGFTPVPFYLAGILLHFGCVLIISRLCVWHKVSARTAFAAACFFAVFEGHCEAVMWIAASSDLLVCLFILLCLICWLKWLAGGSWLWYLGCILALAGAAISKESFFVLPALLLAPLLADRALVTRRALTGILPIGLAAAAYVVWSYLGRVASPGYSDIRFSIHAPWETVLAVSTWRLLFVLGIAALGILLVRYRKGDPGMMSCWLLWIVASLFPNCFLTYMNRVPSRHTYVASVGLAMLVGAAYERLLEIGKPRLVGLIAATVVLINLEILWVKKTSQFQQRSQATELLLQAARQSAGPVEVLCAPLEQIVVTAAVNAAGKEVTYRSGSMKSEQHCFSIRYTDTLGRRQTVDRDLDTQRHGTFY